MTDKELDDLFQNRFSNHQMPVPADMWDRVNPQKDKRRRGIILWWSSLGVAALFVLIGTATWLYHNPAGKEQVSAITKSANTQPVTGAAKNTTPINQLSELNKKKDLAGDSFKEKSSSQTTSSHSKNKTDIANIYTHTNNHKTKTGATINELRIAKSYAINDIQKHKLNSRIAKKETGNSKTRNNTNHELSNPVNSSNSEDAITSFDSQPAIIAQTQPANSQTATVQKPDSNVVAANTATAQQTKAAAVKVKKIHGEKTTGLELMVAGYGNNRHVYDDARFSSAGLVAFGPVSQKEKVLMNSFSLTVRIDKPLTKNISVKTGLQFLQTHQRVSYDYETINQTLSITTTGNDTTLSARLQSKQSVVKGTYNNLSVPVFISYHTNGNKFNIGATAGVLVNVLSWYGGHVPDAGNSQVIEAKKAFRTNTGTSLYAGITVAKNLGGFQLFAEPHIQYTLSSITKSSASFRQKIASYGFGIGIRKSIGK